MMMGPDPGGVGWGRADQYTTGGYRFIETLKVVFVCVHIAGVYVYGIRLQCVIYSTNNKYHVSWRLLPKIIFK